MNAPPHIANVIEDGSGYVLKNEFNKYKLSIEHRLTRSEVLNGGQFLVLIGILLKVFAIV